MKFHFQEGLKRSIQCSPHWPQVPLHIIYYTIILMNLIWTTYQIMKGKMYFLYPLIQESFQSMMHLYVTTSNGDKMNVGEIASMDMAYGHLRMNTIMKRQMKE